MTPEVFLGQKLPCASAEACQDLAGQRLVVNFADDQLALDDLGLLLDVVVGQPDVVSMLGPYLPSWCHPQITHRQYLTAGCARRTISPPPS